MLVHAGRVCAVVVEPVVRLELSLRAGVHIAVSLELLVNVRPHNSPVEILPWSEVVPDPGLLPCPAVVPLAELLELLQLLELRLTQMLQLQLLRPILREPLAK